MKIDVASSDRHAVFVKRKKKENAIFHSTKLEYNEKMKECNTHVEQTSSKSSTNLTISFETKLFRHRLRNHEAENQSQHFPTNRPGAVCAAKEKMFGVRWVSIINHFRYREKKCRFQTCVLLVPHEFEPDETINFTYVEKKVIRWKRKLVWAHFYAYATFVRRLKSQAPISIARPAVKNRCKFISIFFRSIQNKSMVLFLFLVISHAMFGFPFRFLLLFPLWPYHKRTNNSKECCFPPGSSSSRRCQCVECADAASLAMPTWCYTYSFSSRFELRSFR